MIPTEEVCLGSMRRRVIRNVFCGRYPNDRSRSPRRSGATFRVDEGGVGAAAGLR